MRSDYRLGASCGGANEVLFWGRNEHGLWQLSTTVKIGDTVGVGVYNSEGEASNIAVMGLTCIPAIFEREFTTVRCKTCVVGRSNGLFVELNVGRYEGISQVVRKLIGVIHREAVLSVCSSDIESGILYGSSG